VRHAEIRHPKELEFHLQQIFTQVSRLGIERFYCGFCGEFYAVNSNWEDDRYAHVGSHFTGSFPQNSITSIKDWEFLEVFDEKSAVGYAEWRYGSLLPMSREQLWEILPMLQLVECH
jgi:hypothetical protein